MQQGGGDQQEGFHLSGLQPTIRGYNWRTTEMSVIVSALTHVVSTDESFQRAPGVSFMMNSVDSTSSYSSSSTSGSWTAQKRGSIQDRIKSAMRHMQIFYQFWAPVTVAGQRFLTTSDQPYWCDYFDEKIHKYREKSSTHYYSIEIGKEDQLGPPGRVFLQGSPEFSPNVKYYSTKEYYLRDYALFSGVKEYCAFPVFESPGARCVGVLELLPSSMEDWIRKTSDLVLKELRAVDLVSSGVYFHKCNEIYTDRFASRAEIKELLNDLCETHNFPIARAWVPCTCTCPDTPTRGGHQKIRVRDSHSHMMENSVCEAARRCVDEDDDNWDDAEEIYLFRRTCTSLQEGQGLIGKAFSSCKSCFCRDITQFSMIDYPFVHYARECKLTSCFAICLRSIDPRFDIYILELFLAPGGMNNEDPQALLQSLLATVAPRLQNFKVAAGQEEQGEELLPEVHLFSSDDNVDYFQISQSRGALNEFEASGNERDQAQLHSSKEVENINTSYVGGEEREVEVTNSEKEGRIELEGKQEVGDGIITYELVKQHFGRKLEDTAESLGVSRSTLKRICRRLGIRRWPPHKRRKVDSVDSAGIPKSIVVPEKGTSAADFAIQDKNTMVIKATYGDDIIKFPLSISSGIEDLKREVAKRLKVARYSIKYKDEDGDCILMACNDDLHYCMHSQKVLGRTSIQLVVIEN